MKKVLYLLLISVLLVSCSNKRKELFEKTDKFVTSLETISSYGLLNAAKNSETTNDGLYTISPMGRLVNVKIQKVVEEEEYKELQKDLEKHYKNDPRVNKVYINNGGTVMIDCRN